MKTGVLLLGVIVAGSVLAGDPPDSEVNPQSGHVETVYTFSDGNNRNIRRIIDTGPGQPNQIETITTDSSDDLDPKVVITDNGDTWVVWWRDTSTDKVYITRYDFSAKAWSAEELASDAGESSSGPAIMSDGTDVWVAYQYASGSDTGVAVSGGVNEPSPWPSRTVVGTTAHSGDVDVQIHAENGSLWVTWVDSDTDVGWSEYDAPSETWSATSLESYAADTVAEARARIRAAVLGI